MAKRKAKKRRMLSPRSSKLRRLLIAAAGGVILAVMMLSYFAMVAPKPGENPYGIEPDTVRVTVALMGDQAMINVSFVSYGGDWGVGNMTVSWNPNLLVVDFAVVNETMVNNVVKVRKIVSGVVPVGQGLPDKVIVKVGGYIVYAGPLSYVAAQP